jgi:hypothetical protein
MKIHLSISTVIIFALIATPGYSISFTKQTTSDGRVIFSNIPKHCSKSGILTCHQYHPIFSNQVKIEKKVKPVSTQQVTKKHSAFSSPQVKLSKSGNKCHAKGTRHYNITLNFTAFDSIEDCVTAGGDASKN